MITPFGDTQQHAMYKASCSHTTGGVLLNSMQYRLHNGN